MIYITKYLYGLDLSMKCSGVAIFNIDTYEPVSITSIETDDKDTHGYRLHIQREYIKKLIKKYPPYEVAIERSFTRFNNSTQVLYRAHGVANEVLHKYPQYYYPPATVKKIITGDGRSKKDIVRDNILKKIPDLQFSNNDESDAASIAICHLIKKYKMEW